MNAEQEKGLAPIKRLMQRMKKCSAPINNNISYMTAHIGSHIGSIVTEERKKFSSFHSSRSSYKGRMSAIRMKLTTGENNLFSA